MKALNSFESFDVCTYVWETVKTRQTPPTPRFGHSMIKMQHDCAILMGGASKVSNGKPVMCKDNIYLINLDLGDWKAMKTKSGKEPANLFNHYGTMVDELHILIAWQNMDDNLLELSMINMKEMEWTSVML